MEEQNDRKNNTVIPYAAGSKKLQRPFWCISAAPSDKNCLIPREKTTQVEAKQGNVVQLSEVCSESG